MIMEKDYRVLETNMDDDDFFSYEFDTEIPKTEWHIRDKDPDYNTPIKEDDSGDGGQHIEIDQSWITDLSVAAVSILSIAFCGYICLITDFYFLSLTPIMDYLQGTYLLIK